MLSCGTVPQVYLEGTSNLLGLDLHLTQGRLRELFRALEEKKRPDRDARPVSRSRRLSGHPHAAR